MTNTVRFRTQHKELLDIAEKIEELLDAAELSKDATKACHLISQLAGVLNIHLAMEDKSLYPSLFGHQSDRVKAMAQQYSIEMGDIGKLFESYISAWRRVSEIQANSGEFVRQTKQILAKLATRIEKEDQGLYVLVDNMATLA